LALVAGAVFLAVGAIVIESEDRQAETGSGERGGKTVNYLRAVMRKIYSHERNGHEGDGLPWFGLRVGLISRWPERGCERGVFERDLVVMVKRGRERGRGGKVSEG
jgi:hypothetical protein